MDDKLILKNHLKETRIELKLSQSQLADMVGVSRNTISSIETGQFSPTAKLALVLCIALDKKFEELFYFNLVGLILKNHLKETRIELKLSQSQLADMVGVSRNTISSIETGQFSPTAKLALVLCIALDKKFEELFYFNLVDRCDLKDELRNRNC